jgi:beta-fructofuranosidase
MTTFAPDMTGTTPKNKPQPTALFSKIVAGSAHILFLGLLAIGQTSMAQHEADKALSVLQLRDLAGTNCWAVCPNNPVLRPGAKDEWDAGALGSMTVLKVGEVFHMYYEAWGSLGKEGSGADYQTLQIGHAVSPDGVHWAKDPANPVLRKGAGNDWDKDGTWDPFVIYEDGQFKMWYGGSLSDRCDWGYAVSADGSRFVKKGQISHLGEVEDDHVVHDKATGRYFMYYWDRAKAPWDQVMKGPPAPSGLFVAQSKNETDFDFANARRLSIEGQPWPGKYSHVLRDNNRWVMFYGEATVRGTPSATGMAFSENLLDWKKAAFPLMRGHDAEVIEAAPGLWLMYYAPDGFFDMPGCDIRVALFRGKLDDPIRTVSARAKNEEMDQSQSDKERLTTVEKEKPDHSSKVPKYAFGSTLEEQEAQLRDNPLLKRFAKSRESMSGDPYRPGYHYVNPEGELNDPNGFCYWQGRWHLFYQAYPPEDPRQHWGHAVSGDLIHWQDLPYAIYPNPEEMCFSGNIMIEGDRAVAMYPGIPFGEMIAISHDPLLLNWNKLTGDTVYPFKEWKWRQTHTDPFLFKEGDAYYCIIGGIEPNGPGGKPVRANYLSKSKDLINWQYVHEFVEDDRYSLVGDDGSCPYFLPIGDKHILIYFTHYSASKYLIGEYDKEKMKFKVLNGGNFNRGPVHPSGLCAPSAFPDGKGGVIAMINLGAGKGPLVGNWNQIVSLPLKLGLRGVDQLNVEPAGDIESLRYDHKKITDLKLPANKDVMLDGINGRAMELDIEIGINDAPMIEIDVRCSPNREECTRIVFQNRRGYQPDLRTQARFGRIDTGKIESKITIDDTRSSLFPDVRSRGSETAYYLMEDGNLLKLRIFVDHSSVEVFAGGKEYLATRIYPSLPESTGVSIRSQGKNAVLRNLDAWQMKSIW